MPGPEKVLFIYRMKDEKFLSTAMTDREERILAGIT
jgi:hypothetical protein